jgi:Domain of unknown function (DUF4126)
LLDSVAAPAAVIAGIGVSAAIMADLPPMLKWTLAIIAGGGAASVTQGTTTAFRTASTLLTAGFGNPVIASIELVAAAALSILAIISPFIAVILLAGFVLVAYRLLRKWRKRNETVAASTEI